MNDVEQRLAQWLQAETPEPPRQVTAAQTFAAAAARQARPERTRQRWIPLLSAAVLITVIVAVAAVVTTVSRRATPTERHTTPAITTPVPTVATAGLPARPPADFDRLRLIGSHGSTAWRLTDTFEVTSDSGTRWRSVALPRGVPAGSVDSADVDPAGDIRLLERTNESMRLYTRAPAGSTWQVANLADSGPAGGQGMRAALGTIEYGSHGVVVVLASWGTGLMTNDNDLFISTDGGVHFARYPTGITQRITSITVLTSTQLIAIAGYADNLVYRSDDGGRHWSRLLGGTTTDVSYVRPTVNGDRIDMARITGIKNGVAVSILSSGDFGTHFTASKPLPVTANANSPYGVLDVAFSGDRVWIPTDHDIYESADLGRTWTDVPTETSVDAVTLGDGGTAIAQAASNCSSNLPQGCALTNYLVVTHDGGRTWTAL